MYDNLNSFRALFTGCETATEQFEGLGAITVVTRTEEGGNIDIYPADTQASLEPFFGANGDYFLVSYIGDTPDLRYGYHIDGEDQGDIFSLSDTGKMFSKVRFNPNDDLVTGTFSKPVPIMMITGEPITKGLEENVEVKIKTLIIQMMFGEISEEGQIKPVIDIMTIADGRRILLGRSNTDNVAYGTLRKKFNIGLKENTKLLSFSFGNNPTDDSNIPDTLLRQEPTLLHKLAADVDYGDNIKKFMKMLDTPNKIYNTEATI